MPLPTPGDLPKPGIEPASLASPALASGSFTTVLPENLRQFWGPYLEIGFFADDQVKMKSLEWDKIQYDCVLTKNGKFEYRYIQKETTV